MSDRSVQQSTQLLRERLAISVAAKSASAKRHGEQGVDIPVAEQQEPASAVAEDSPAPTGPQAKASEQCTSVGAEPDGAEACSGPPVADPPATPSGPPSSPQGPASAPEPAAVSAEPDTSEQRKSRRKSTRLAGVICNAGSRTPINCIIRDMSAAGAYVVVERCGTSAFSGTPQIGDKFTLYLTYDRMAVPCVLQWRKGEAIGASFLTAPTFY